ncbi:retinol dehydrogenase 12 [Poronia punctata]|nr:retinol dehydrogenase 12 [Poronia punctata]
MSNTPNLEKHSRPTAATSASDLVGKTAIVTGSNSGIGLECARQFLDRGLTRLILAVRDEKRGEVARQNLRDGRQLDHAVTIEVWHLDYSSYDSILSFADRARSLENLDIVVLNAGTYRLSRVIIQSTGHEEDVQVNYLSTALLTILFIPILESKKRHNAKPGRMTIVSSSVAAWSRFKPSSDGSPLLQTLDGSKKFDHHQQYCTSKLLGHLFLEELTRRVRSSTVVINCVNPGLCYGSGLTRDGAGTLLGFIVGIIFRIFGHSCVSGARAVVDAALVQDDESHGRYLDGGKPVPYASVIYTAEGREMSKMLWEETMNELSFSDAENIVRAHTV